MTAGAILEITGRALPLVGDDIDTDRIMPARFLRATSFDGLERHVFEDDRAANPRHPFDDPRYAGAAILVVNRNFGSGSSREHAPQGLVRWGIGAVIGESFAEIFQGNSAVLGLPCFAAARSDVEQLQSLVADDPAIVVRAEVESGTIEAGGRRFAATLPPALRDAFVKGEWNPTMMLLDRFEEVRAVARQLPYVVGF